VKIRPFVMGDLPQVWALGAMPWRGATADPTAPRELPVPDRAPTPDLDDPVASYRGRGGDFLVMEDDGGVLVGMGAIRRNERGQAEIKRVRIHPARRREGLARRLAQALDARAAELGFEELHLDTSIEQPEAIAFWRSIGFVQAGTERVRQRQLVYFTKPVGRPATSGESLVAASGVERDGDVVLRPWTSSTPAVHALLAHLEAVGFPGAPRLVDGGRHPDGRQQLTFVPGREASPSGWTDAGIAEVGRLLRALHEATASFVPPPDAVWAMTDRVRTGDDLVFGHGDVGPWNVVERDGLPVAWIDWEWAGPVRRLDEVADAARKHCQLHGADVAARQGLLPAADRARQLGLFADAYGLADDDRRGLVDRMAEVALRGIAFDADDATVTMEFVGPHPMIYGMAWQARGGVWILDHRDVLEAALLG
jgi:ribosomal protein S18 acetylase RimI-like enzyme